MLYYSFYCFRLQYLFVVRMYCSYNLTFPLRFACDASPFGVVVVLAHEMPYSSERSISYGSNSLSAAEKNYSQLGEEALATIFGVRRFHVYL